MPPSNASPDSVAPKPKSGGGRGRRRGGRGGRGRGRGGGGNANNSGSGRNSGSTQSQAQGGTGRGLRRGAQRDTEGEVSDNKTGNPTTDKNVCSICAEVATDWAVGKCMHTVCSRCSHRMRVLYKRESCVLCNSMLNEVTVVPADKFDPEADYGSVRAQALIYDPEVTMHFWDPIRRDELAAIRGFTCSKDKYVCSTGPKLKQYVRSTHNSLYCNLCFSGGEAFVSELPIYPLAGNGSGGCPKLRKHMNEKHPTCNYCHSSHLNDDALYQHLQEKHETCFICERRGRIHEYYRDYEQLEAHYKSEHFPCPHPQCRGVVFANEVDLQGHILQHHSAGTSRSARRVQVNLADIPVSVSEPDVREEQNRQAARRRAFAASHAVFTEDVAISNSNRQAESTASRQQQSVGSRGGRQPQAGGTTRGSNGRLPPSSGANSRLPTPGDASPPPAAAQRVPSSRPAQNNVQVHGSGSSSSAGASSSSAVPEGEYRPLPLPQSQEEAEARSRKLMRTMRNTLDPSAFETFKEASAEFRDGAIDAKAYYDATTDAFGVRQAIRDIFPELIALLPDVGLRNDLTNALKGRHNTRLAPQSTIDFPSLEGQRAVAPNLMPTVRTGYMPVPQAGDFPSLAGRGRAARGNAAPAPVAQPMPALNLQRVFGGPTTPTNLPTPRRTHRNLTDAFGPFPALTNNSSGPSLAHRARPQAPYPPSVAATPLRARPQAPQRPQAPPRPLAQTQRPPSQSAFPSLAETSGSPQFPSLSVISAAMLESEASHRAAEPAPAPDPDVTNRAGAVWGGAASSTAARRKRGPGRGPAPAPPAVFGTPAVLATNARPDPPLTLAEQIRSERSEARRRVESSALPRVGPGGFGFAWERKAQQRKKKQIRSAFNAQSGGSSRPGDDGAGPAASA